MDTEKRLPPLKVKRKTTILKSENFRVITRLYIPGPEYRVRNVINRALGLSEEDVHSTMSNVLENFSDRHRNFRESLKKNFRSVQDYIPEGAEISDERRLLIGAYFTMEYAIEAAALFNPSIVPHPDQRKVPDGTTRFIMSFRATGEGHISSIEFRSGTIDKNDDIYFDPTSKYVETPEIHPYPVYNTHLFRFKLNEMGASNFVTDRLLNELGEEFTLERLQEKINEIKNTPKSPEKERNEAIDMAMWVARSNYTMKFHADHRISERVIYPVSENESRGIEDARFVRFTNDDGAATYYATYTAYNGFVILPQLMETKDFLTFNITTLNGKAVQNKGMALFPRKIKGKYVMLSRQDGENNHIMFSDQLHFWQKAEIIRTPTLPYEFVQIGNCGSPIETPHGWLTLVHGVGPMRRYSIGIELLDLEDPSKIISRINEPIITPTNQEREGYVPNVVYTCGAMIHQNKLIIPYATADQRCGIATVNVSDLLERLGVKNPYCPI